MDKRQKKQMRQKWREKQRSEARSKFPLPPSELKAMFDTLADDLHKQGCDHSRRLTKVWLASRGHDIHAVFAWLDENGGFCDCEVLANSEQYFEEAMHDVE
jgi:Protein of unknown function (DUF2695)